MFTHAQMILEILCELVRLWTSYTWLLFGEITKPDIQLAVWQLCLRLRGDGFHYQRHNGWHDNDYGTTTASSTVTVLVAETNGSLIVDGLNPVGSHRKLCVFTTVDAFDRIQLLSFQRKINRQTAQTWTFYQSPHLLAAVRWISLRWMCFGAMR